MLKNCKFKIFVIFNMIIIRICVIMLRSTSRLCSRTFHESVMFSVRSRDINSVRKLKLIQPVDFKDDIKKYCNNEIMLNCNKVSDLHNDIVMKKSLLFKNIINIFCGFGYSFIIMQFDNHYAMRYPVLHISGLIFIVVNGFLVLVRTIKYVIDKYNIYKLNKDSNTLRSMCNLFYN